VIGPLAAIVLLVTSAQLFERNGLPLPRFALLDKLEIWLQPFRSLNRYGLFAVMTTSRPEIILEGSRDGKAWTAFRFKYKPGELKMRPRFVAPYMPRLDWQMWFAALGSYRANPWFINFCVRLLHGSPEVVGLLEGNPFPDAPPRFIRATVYEYHFTDPATFRREGAWWRSELKGEYCPILSLRDTGQ
jgi:hypothetical protein